MLDIPSLRAKAEGAMLAAAVGDALGWPQEFRSRSTGISKQLQPRFDFVSWRRRAGGRFAAHEELIRAGSYSDDTQLILALARSYGWGDGWHDRWTSIELPFWLTYEQGGGAATKRAARTWSAGKKPWLDKGFSDYFEAGGNGVAMRVLPHCLWHVADQDFRLLGRDVVLDGISTHGHPVALVGALAYAYALWHALRQTEPLEYGQLLTITTHGVGEWSSYISELPESWIERANDHFELGYGALWDDQVTWMLSLLTVAQEGLGQGALAVDQETLRAIGAFDKTVSGAGTVAAASAIFLASRYASSPTQGLVAAAFALGADTDTISSMAGGLLGAINGRDWLTSVLPSLQDHDYLLQQAGRVVDHETVGDLLVNGARRPSIPAFIASLRTAKPGGQLTLPDGRTAVVEEVRDLPTSTRNEIKINVLAVEDGQTLFVKRTSRLSTPRKDAPTEYVSGPPKVAIAVDTHDMRASVRFYRDTLGLDILWETPDSVNFGGLLLLAHKRTADKQPRLTGPEAPASQAPSLFIFYPNARIASVIEKLRAAGASFEETRARGRRSAHCLDPNGVRVEVIESSD